MGREYLLHLSWPKKELSSNARVHWATKSRITKAYRTEGWAVARAMNAKGNILEFTYYPPDKRRRDAQNMPHMLKAAIDGIADGMGVDDIDFQCTFPSKFENVTKNGAILVHVKGEKDDS